VSTAIGSVKLNLPKPLSSAVPHAPPPMPVRWRGTAKGTRSSAECDERTWFEARQKLMSELGVGPGEITMEMVPESPESLEPGRRRL